MTLSTHVLDAVTGRPAVDVRVVVERRSGSGWEPVAERRTDGDGRVAAFGALTAGVHRIVFDVEGYSGPDCFYPEVAVTFRVTDPAAHLHVPLLLSPFAYSTYRGS